MSMHIREMSIDIREKAINIKEMLTHIGEMSIDIKEMLIHIGEMSIDIREKAINIKEMLTRIREKAINIARMQSQLPLANLIYNTEIPIKRYEDTPLVVFHGVYNHRIFASDIQHAFSQIINKSIRFCLRRQN